MIEAIRAATGCDVFGKLVGQVRDLVERAGGAGPVLDVVPEIDAVGPPRLKAPAFVQALDRALVDAGAREVERIEALRRRRKSLEALIATYRAEGVEPEPELAELAAVELQLDGALGRPAPPEPTPPTVEAVRHDWAALRARLVAAGHPPQVASGLIGWQMCLAAGEPHGLHHKTIARYRRHMAALPRSTGDAFPGIDDQAAFPGLDD